MRAADVEKEFELGNPRAKVLRTIFELAHSRRARRSDLLKLRRSRSAPAVALRASMSQNIDCGTSTIRRTTNSGPNFRQSWLSLREPPALLGQPMAIVFSHPEGEAASTLAVVVSSHKSLLFLASDFTVIAASVSFCQTFQIDPTNLVGRRLGDLGAGEWALPQLTSLLKATASGNAQIEAYEIELRRKGHETRCLPLNARKLDDGGALGVRLLWR